MELEKTYDDYIEQYIEHKNDIKQITMKNETKCDNCNEETEIVENLKDGVVVCNNCGNICENEIIMDTPEWVYYGNDDSKKGGDPARCYPINHLYKNSSTLILGEGKTKYKSKYKTIFAQSLITMDPEDRKLYNTIEGENGIKKLINRQLPQSIVYRTSLLCKKFNKIFNEDGTYKVLRGNTRKGFISACIYYACQKESINKSKTDICEITRCDLIDLNKGIKILSDNLNIKLESKYSIDYVEIYANNLNLDNEIIEIVKDTAFYSEQYIYDKTPQAIAAGSIYYVLKDLDMLKYMNNKNKRLKDVFGITMVTVTKVYKLIKENEDKILKHLE